VDASGDTLPSGISSRSDTCGGRTEPRFQKKYAELWKLWLEADKLIETIPRHGTSAGSSPACGANAGIPSSRSDQIRGFRERENMGQSSLFWSPWFFRRFATFLLRGFYVNVCIPTLNQQKSAYISA